MSRRYFNECLGSTVYISAVCVCVLSASPARAQGESASPPASSPPSTTPLSSVTPPPDSSLSADYVRTHSADYVRKPTEPPKFDPNSQPAASARTEATRDVAKPKNKPPRDDAESTMVPQGAAPKQTPASPEPGAEASSTPPPARATRRGPMIAPIIEPQTN